MSTNKTLFVTVGGSYKPILTAIKTIQPTHIVFLCTGPDPATGKRGSESQITGKGKVISSQFGAPADLYNIPSQAGLADQDWEMVQIPSDDLDQCYRTISDQLQRAAAPDTQLIADYTGGTKTMSAALVLASLDRNDVVLNLVTGTRSNLRQVNDGTESSMHTPVEAMRFERALNTHLALWRRSAYGEAAAGLAAMPAPTNQQMRGLYQRALDLSRAFDAWDRFDHQQARNILQEYGPVCGRQLSQHLAFLASLCSGPEHPRLEPARLLDLWSNAERRMEQGRWDDAIARLYRLLEWTAQWQLREQKQIDTADVQPEQLPADFTANPASDGRIKVGLMDAWKLAGHHCDGDFARFAKDKQKTLLNHIRHRNASILAHGFSPIAQQQAEEMQHWMTKELLPLLQAAARKQGIQPPPPLPQRPCW